MRPFEQNLTHQKHDPYRYFNFALLHTRGLDHVFDMMRYDSAFLARYADFDRLLKAADNYGDYVLQPFSILLCKYDFRGKTKANWTPARLLSDQKYEEVPDPLVLMQLNSDVYDYQPHKPLKYRSELVLKGTLAMILKVMYDNKAIPANEKDANAMERTLYMPAEEIEVTLANYQDEERFWVAK
jgi:hypothetical protein